MTYLASDVLRPEIGRGRSGIVYAQYDGNGRGLACKVFDSRGLTKAVQLLTLGAPNPYVWNNDAVQSAKLRRNILKHLVPFWMDGKADVADAVAAIRNEDHKTYELQTQMIDGWAAHLQHPLSDTFKDEAEHLWQDLMPALRVHLQNAGFDGLLWQAGEGNPVALNNFLFEPDNPSPSYHDRTRPTGRWVWIDLESGVPAIFPVSMKVLLGYSFRHWKRLGRPMFDDVDVGRLTEYIETNAEELKKALGPSSYRTVLSDAQRLGENQERWKSISRLGSSIGYRLARGDITQAEADYYADRKTAWYLKETNRSLVSSAAAAKRGLARILHHAKNVNLPAIIRSTWRFLVSQKYREEFIHEHLRESIKKWERRGQMSAPDARLLLRQVGAPEASVFITDFGIHLAIKPVVKVAQYWVLPALFALGVLSGSTVALLILAGGALARSAYTLGRLVQSTARGTERPWVALGIGTLPIVGNLAYPAQMIYSSGGKDEKLAQFMIDDGFARVGRHLPIWGGEDTWTEHKLNRMPRSIHRWIRSMRKRKGQERARP